MNTSNNFFTNKAKKLRQQCLRELDLKIYNSQSGPKGYENYASFKLDFSTAYLSGYDYIIKIERDWQLLDKDSYLFGTDMLSTEELCELVDYIMEQY